MDQDLIQKQRDEEKRQSERQEQLDSVVGIGSKLDKALNFQTNKLIANAKTRTNKVKLLDPVASPKDIQAVVAGLNDLANKLAPKELKPVVTALETVVSEIAKLPKDFPKYPDFPKFPELPKSTKVDNLNEIKPWLEAVVVAVGKLELNPQIEVKAGDVNIPETKVDLAPINQGLTDVKKALDKIKLPEIDVSRLVAEVKKTTNAINGLSFPVPNYVLPFKDINGAGVQVQLDASGNVPTSGGGAGGGLTDAELRATPVPVTANAGTNLNTSLLATAANQLPNNHNVVVTSAPTTAVTGTFWQATQPVSGTVTAVAQPGVDIGDVTVNNASGASAVNIQDGGNSITVDGTFYQATQPVSLASVPSHAVTNAGTFVVQENGAALTALQLLDNIVSGSGVNITQVGGTNIDTNSGNKSAGTQRMVLATDQPNLTTPLNVAISGSATATGVTISKTDALVATATAVKAAAGNVYGYHVYNSNAADAFVHFYNIAAGSVTVGTSTRLYTIFVPGGGVLDTSLAFPIAFSTAIAIAATTTITGNTAPAVGLLTDVMYI